VLIERLLLERISLRGSCRAVGSGLRWLLQVMGARFAAAPDHTSRASRRDGVADLDTIGSYREAFQHFNFLQVQS
jgi:hypothetical protein